jgi:hypothetical protein
MGPCGQPHRLSEGKLARCLTEVVMLVNPWSWVFDGDRDSVGFAKFGVGES